MLFQNATLRTLILSGYRVYAKSIFFLPEPRILVNSIPKAGTHLLTAFLCELPKVMLSGTHIKNWKVNSNAHGPLDNDVFSFDVEAFEKLICAANTGQIITAHLPWMNTLAEVLTAHNVRTIFLIRDPRDVVVSKLHYIKSLQRHHFHDFLTRRIDNDEDRLMALIKGIDGEYKGRKYKMKSIGEILKDYSGWVKYHQAITTQFEMIIGDRGGGNIERQEAEFKRIADFVGRPLDRNRLREIVNRLATKSSFTLRRGIIGDWRNHFKNNHKAVFKATTGRNLIDWGYEIDLDW